MYAFIFNAYKKLQKLSLNVSSVSYRSPMRSMFRCMVAASSANSANAGSRKSSPVGPLSVPVDRASADSEP